jgi:adenosylmethionine---8-amino-7-oxononanoate aminotransferase
MLSDFLSTGMSKTLSTKDQEIIWHPYSSLVGNQPNIVVKSASGVYLNTEDGRAILDAVSSWWVNLHGHAHPYLAQKIAEQASVMEHVIFAGFTHEPAVRLAERLIKILPGEQKKIFFSDNGSTAVEVAIKLAIQYHYNKGRTPGKIIAIEGAFHGDTFGAMSVSERGLFTGHFGKYLFETAYIPFPENGKEAFTIQSFEENIRKENISAFLYEPLVQGASGMRIYSPEILERLLSIAKKNNIICIADEVMTGFGRTGKLFASEYMKNKPDIICLSKGITGGFMPLGVTSCNGEIESAFLSPEVDKIFYHGHSFTGNPLACSVSNASLDLLLTEEYSEKIKFIQKSHMAFLKTVEGNKVIRKINVLGTILSIEINSSEASGYTNSIRDELYNFFLSRNILLRPLGNVIYVIPPYIINEKELKIIYSAIVDLLKSREN